MIGKQKPITTRAENRSCAADNLEIKQIVTEATCLKSSMFGRI